MDLFASGCVLLEYCFFGSLRSPQRALPTVTKVESGTSQSKRGTSVDFSSSVVVEYSEPEIPNMAGFTNTAMVRKAIEENPGAADFIRGHVSLGRL